MIYLRFGARRTGPASEEGATPSILILHLRVKWDLSNQNTNIGSTSQMFSNIIYNSLFFYSVPEWN